MIERRYCELRVADASGREITGTAVRYGDVARLPWGRERVQPGAFGEGVARADVLLNLQHDRGQPLARTGGGGLTLTDSPEALTVRASLPATRLGDDTLALVRGNVLRGLSVEMRVTGERPEGGVRVVERAKLVGIGIVDRPAFPASEIEARQARGRAIRGKVNLGKPLACRCRKNCNRIIIEPEAFDTALAEAASGNREITGFLSGHFDTPLASVSAGTLRIRRAGSVLNVTIARLTDTGPVRDWYASLGAARYYFRPYFPDDQSTFRVEGTTARFSEADLRAIEIAPLTGPTEGLEEIAVGRAERREAAPTAPRVRVWL